jgi:hypothetical protein
MDGLMDGWWTENTFFSIGFLLPLANHKSWFQFLLVFYYPPANKPLALTTYLPTSYLLSYLPTYLTYILSNSILTIEGPTYLPTYLPTHMTYFSGNNILTIEGPTYYLPTWAYFLGNSILTIEGPYLPTHMGLFSRQ